MSSATKKFALATLTTSVLAALAIGLAGSAVAAPAGPPSDVGPGVDPILSVEMTPAFGAVTIRFRLGKATAGSGRPARRSPAGRTTRGATQRKPLLGHSPYLAQY